MDKVGDTETDGTSIKPVSSLRAKFEELQTKQATKVEGGPVREAGSKLKPQDTPRGAPFVRASLDIARPYSPWEGFVDLGQQPPQTPVGRARSHSKSPTRSNHKRPMSLSIHSSPQLAPAVKIESPGSPPRLFFGRSGSRSPERTDINPLAKVRDLVSQHSSRASTRSSTPAPSGSQGGLKDGPVLIPSVETHRPKSPIPPPVNRAEKPKIPTKPHNVINSSQERKLSTDFALINKDSGASPFNTPPSSDGSPSPPPEVANPRDVPPKISSIRRGSAQPTAMESSSQSRQNDPRLLGFASTPSISERKDPRLLGFSSAPDAPRPPSRDTKPGVTPIRVGTFDERTMRDARDLGFSSNTSGPRPTVDNIRTVLPPPKSNEAARPTPTRDARQLGFSNPSTPTVSADEGKRPELPTRPVARIPPPRPSEDSKRPVYQPGIMRAQQKTSSGIAPVESQTPRLVDVARKLIPPSSDIHFPPPPKRSTWKDGDDSTSAGIPNVYSRNSPQHSDAALKQYKNDSEENEGSRPDPVAARHDYPDSTQTNRRPPLLPNGLHAVNGKTDGKVFDICGQYLCTASYVTRVFDMTTGENIMSINHGDTVKITAAIFKPGDRADMEGKRLWLGSNIGDLHEIDIETHSIVTTSSAHNRREIIKIMRYQKDLWTLDDDGKLLIWPANKGSSPDLKYSHTSYKTVKGPTFSMVVKDTLWLAAGKETRVYRPGHDSSFNVVKNSLSQPGTGDVTSGAFAMNDGGKVYLGHADGKVTVYSTKDYTCLSTLKISDYKINGLAFVGDKLWAAYKTGKIYVYDTSMTPWKVDKDWRAHDGPATGILLDPSSTWTLQQIQVATAGHDGAIRLWDGTLEDDWIENEMYRQDVQYCSFRDVRAAVVTWNCGATTPELLRNHHFIADAIHSEEGDPPEILCFGFQEVVDLEDRAVTAKSLLGFGKKKDTTKTSEQHQSRVYREWRDYLRRAIEQYIPHHVYTELHTSSLIGLFQCVFIRTDEKPNITNHVSGIVKCGMGGHYGNKGALIARFVLDDSSICLINCHLAAGQTQTSNRNNDVATILEADSLPSESNLDIRSTLFVGGGDGSQILDHEICILNGDLNYRIDAIPRDTVLKMIQNNELGKLLERDQIYVSRRRVSGFRLAPFTELPITFPPTYKYDVGKDTYDTSEKKRVPAWCDRLLYRGPPSRGRVKQLEYCQHPNVRLSDHRPVSGVFRLKVKRVDHTAKERTKEDCYRKFAEVRRRLFEQASVKYLVEYLGVDVREARALILGTSKSRK